MNLKLNMITDLNFKLTYNKFSLFLLHAFSQFCRIRIGGVFFKLEELACLGVSCCVSVEIRLD